MLTIEQKKAVAGKIIPLLDGWNINDALDALDYAKGYLGDFCKVQVNPDPAVRASFCKD